MSSTRLNGIIRAWEEGKVAYSCFAKADKQSAIDLSESPYDALMFEMEHNPWDMAALQDSLQYLLNRKQIHAGGSLAPAVTPLVRIPANGVEMNQAYAKQALDRGVYGIVWPHINDVAQAYNAVASCRYGRPKNAPIYEPRGVRGDAPTTAARYWGLTTAKYYEKADVWPLAPHGELLVGLMIESVKGVENLDEILKEVPGIGFILIGEGDLSQEMGFPRQYDHPEVRDAMRKISETCVRHGVQVGNPHTNAKNHDRLVEEGYRYLMVAPQKSYGVVGQAREGASY